MAFDFKKEYKEFYMPKGKPGIVILTIPLFLKDSLRRNGLFLLTKQQLNSQSVRIILFRSPKVAAKAYF